MNDSNLVSDVNITTPASGLPRVNYYLPVVVTLLATVVLLLLMLGLVFLGIANVVTQLGRMSDNVPGASPVVAGVCGVVSLLALVGVVYFVLALVKGVRDLREPIYYTRGSVAAGNLREGRKAKNWLVVEPEYIGFDTAEASEIDDGHRDASVDRSQIFQPRLTGAPSRGKPSRADADIARELAAIEGRSSYLRPERISSSSSPDLPDDEKDRIAPRAVFRIDFASRAGFQAGEDVLVAHSRFLQHIFYIARLHNGQWEVLRNKALI